MNSTDKLIFDDLNMIIKDESGKKFIADVTPRPNNSSGYVTQCNIAQRMVQCYNEFPFNHHEDPSDLKRNYNNSKLDIDILQSERSKLSDEISRLKLSQSEMTGRLDSLLHRKQSLESDNLKLMEISTDYAEKLISVRELIRKINTPKNKTASKLKSELSALEEGLIGYIENKGI